MGVAETVKYLWVLKRCVWCHKHIRPEDLEHTTDPVFGGDVFFQHKGKCPEIDPLDSPD